MKRPVRAVLRSTVRSHKVAAFLSCLVTASAFAATMTPADVIRVFKNHEALNTAFVAAFEAGRDGRTEPYEKARKALENHGDGPLASALTASVALVCDVKDATVVSSLMHLILATQGNSADETPAATLGAIFLCQPELVSKSFRSLSALQQSALYDGLEFGVRSAEIDHARPATDLSSVESKLKALRPKERK